jgi:hypothetical protein
MTWIIIAAEALVVVVIVVRMIMKRKAIGRDEDVGTLHEDRPADSEVNLPDEERWE